MKHETVSALIEKAIGIAGSQTRLGELCGVSQNAIWQARERKPVFRANLAASIDKATSGEVPRWKLRPDLWEAPKRARASA